MEKPNNGILHAALALHDGSLWLGTGFGEAVKVTGEVVFNTGMIGYTQSVTDPSYAGQLLCQTYPMIGNYGVCRQEFQSDSPKISGYAVYEACANPSHYTSETGVHEWLKKSGIPGIQGVDTRELTKTLRNEGTMLGALEVSENPIDKSQLMEDAKSARDPNARDLVAEVTIPRPVIHPSEGPKIVIIDCGMKMSIAKSLLARGANIVRVPAKYSADRIMENRPCGIVISNGPGDPKMVPYVTKTVKDLMEYGIPVMGICLGNQILGHAFGCDTYRLKFGHRGQNHPAMEKSTGRCYITSQNHGYAISPESVSDKDLEISFVNVNDGTVEGIEHRKLPVFGVQFHQEAAPGPVETGFLFDKFMKEVVRFDGKG
jgi:carbamoyl-phosphate synthase small subunit